MDLMETVEETKKQYIVVKIGSEQYGIDISYIDNIVRMQKITRVPTSQFYFKGVINLRGEVIPVMSIRRKMGLEDDVYTGASRIIILKFEQKDALGVVVDEVREVINLGTSDVDKVSHGQDGKETFINGIGKHGEELVSLFDITTFTDEHEGA